jgi:multisubunit Na+/H+ antiporter MnhB subunit
MPDYDAIFNLQTHYVQFSVPLIHFVSLFYLFYPQTGNGDDGGLFPFTALATGALFTIGITVFLIVIIALRKNRQQTQSHENGLKEKHLGEFFRG